MEQEPIKEFELTYRVACETHGYLGQAVGARLAMDLFIDHFKLVRDMKFDTPMCEGYEIQPINEPWAFVPP